MSEQNLYTSPKRKNSKWKTGMLLIVFILSIVFIGLLVNSISQSEDFLADKNTIETTPTVEPTNTPEPKPEKTETVEEFVTEIPDKLITSIKLTKDKKDFNCSILNSDNIVFNEDKTTATTTKYGISDNIYIIYKATDYKYYKLMEDIVNSDKFAISKIKGYVDYKAGSAKDFNSHKKIDITYTMKNNDKTIVFNKCMLFKMVNDNYILVHNITYQEESMTRNDLKILEKYLVDISNS